jgi:hypothetical protein
MPMLEEAGAGRVKTHGADDAFGAISPICPISAPDSVLHSIFGPAHVEEAIVTGESITYEPVDEGPIAPRTLHRLAGRVARNRELRVGSDKGTHLVGT